MCIYKTMFLHFLQYAGLQFGCSASNDVPSCCPVTLTVTNSINPNHLAGPCLNWTAWHGIENSLVAEMCRLAQACWNYERRAPGHWKPPLSLLLAQTQPPFCSSWSPPAWPGRGTGAVDGPHQPSSQRGPATCRSTAPACWPKPAVKRWRGKVEVDDKREMMQGSHYSVKNKFLEALSDLLWLGKLS